MKWFFLLALTLAPSDSHALDFTATFTKAGICNHKKYPIYVAFADEDPIMSQDKVLVRGWIAVQPGSCNHIGNHLQSSLVYVWGKEGKALKEFLPPGGATALPSRKLCVDEKAFLWYGDEKKCPAKNQRTFNSFVDRLDKDGLWSIE